MDRIPALTVEVIVDDGSTESIGTLTVPLDDDPLTASRMIALYLNEALTALRSTKKGTPWNFYVSAGVERCDPPNPTQRRWKAWLANQGVLPAIQWVKTPYNHLLPLEPNDQGNESS